MTEIQKTMNLFHKMNPNLTPPSERCAVDPGCGTGIRCDDSIHRCPEHAVQAGYCGLCGEQVESDTPVCPSCKAAYAPDEDLLIGDPHELNCGNCGETVVHRGDLERGSVCVSCGGYLKG